jgi:glutaminyl-peptide cyclotransferase
MDLVRMQVRLGPRAPGTAAHDELSRLLEARLREHAGETVVQRFDVPFRGAVLRCSNIIGVFRARGGGTAGAGDGQGSPLLLCTHYDTRVRADRERDEARREEPIAGANDGGSGTAVLLHMLPELARESLARDVAVAFVDAEDLGNIDGKEFSLGAAWLADHPVDGFAPGEVVALDMVGGRGMVLDVDAHAFLHEPSRRLTEAVFRTGWALGLAPFTRDKPGKAKYIVSDHAPFLARGIAACLLIDIDYPEWHTQADLPEAMAGESMAAVEAALWKLLGRTGTGRP